MMIEEFYAAGGPNVDDESYEKIQDVYCAYNRFVTKGQIASFCKEHGSNGIEVMMEPLDKYRSLKRTDEDIQEKIARLQKRICELNESRKELQVKMDNVALQCDLSSNWCRWA